MSALRLVRPVATRDPLAFSDALYVAEREVLAIALTVAARDPSIVARARAALDDCPRPFFDPVHQAIWEAIVVAHDAGDGGIVPVMAALDAAHRTDAVGGWEGVSAFVQRDVIPAEMPRHAARVRQAAVERTLRARVADVLDADCPVAERITRLRTTAASLTADPPVPEDAADAAWDAAREFEQSRTEGPTTGLAAVDTMTDAWQPGWMVVIAARTGQGKTALALQVTRRMIDAGRPVVYVSLEMTRRALLQRVYATRLDLSCQAIRQTIHTDPRVAARVSDMARQAAAWPWSVIEPGTWTADAIAAHARQQAAQGRCALLVVDHVGLVAPRPGKRDATREQEVAHASRTFKLLAGECGIPVLVVAQLNRNVEHRGPEAVPRLTDLRDSGSLEQDADLVLLLSRRTLAAGESEPRVGRTAMRVDVAKARHGATGETGATFIAPVTRFEDTP